MDDFERPGSEQLTDLHVYVIPPDHWRSHLQSAVNQIVNEAVSAGFVRVAPETTIYHLREEFEQQLGYDILPQQFVFLKSVGRCFTRVRPRQEHQLKVKHFLPPSPPGTEESRQIPNALAPEVFVLEATPEISKVPYSGSSSQSSVRHDPRYPPPHARDVTPRSDRSEFTGHKPIPPIRNHIAIQTSDVLDAPPGYPHVQTYPHRDPPARPPPEPEQEPQQNLTPEPFRNIGTQYSRPPTPYYETHHHSPRPTPRTNNPPDPSDSRYEQVNTPRDHPKIRVSSPVFGETPRKSRNETKRVAFEDYLQVDQAPARSPDRYNPPGGPPTHRSNQPDQGQQGRAGGEEYLPPLSASPPNSAGGHGRGQYQHSPGASKHPANSQRSPRHPNNLHPNYSAEESGISDGPELTPEEQQRVEQLMREEEDADERRRQRLLQEDHEKTQQERDQRDWEEEQERRRRAQEQLEEELRRREEDDDRKRQMQHPGGTGRNSENQSRSHSQGPKDSSDLSALKEELRLAKEQRQDLEKLREELVKKAKHIQNKTQQKRSQARDQWKKKYFEEKRHTAPMEEQCNKLRQELEMLHRKIMSQLEGAKDPAKRVGDNKPSQQSNLKIQATRLGHDIEDLQRRVENVKMKLTTEMKLRSQAEGELKALRAELTQNKISVALTRGQGHRPQQAAAIGHMAPPSHGHNQQGHLLSPRS